MLRYWRLLSEQLRQSDPFHCEAVMAGCDRSALPSVGKIQKQLIRRVIYPSVVWANTKGDIAHVLDHSWADMLDWTRRRQKKVVTVHDLIPLRFPGELSVGQTRRFHTWAEHLKKADAIISVSEHTKSETVALLGISPERIFVVPNGVSLPPKSVFCGRVSRRIGKSGYVRDRDLVIGSVGSNLLRKNLGIFPRALEEFRNVTGVRPILLRAGDLLPRDLRAKAEKRIGLANLIELGYVTDRELEEFYSLIDVMVVPSLYEGFGLPVIEAMSRGIPVIASNSTSLPEVGRESALYFEPSDSDQLATQLGRLLDPEIASDLRERGLERSRLFTWKNTLEGIFDVYRTVI